MADKTDTQGYQVLAEACEHTYEEKRSLFTSLLLPVTSREEAMDALAGVRRSRPGASHYCWAYILGAADQPQGQAFSDDGEPSGTAGKPILNVLTQRGAGNCLAVVVRVFGGTKLGAGGLVRAYSSSVSQALDQAAWRKVTPSTPMLVDVGFAQEERVRRLLEQYELEVEQVDYQKAVRLSVSIPKAQLEKFCKDLQEITAGQGRVINKK